MMHLCELESEEISPLSAEAILAEALPHSLYEDYRDLARTDDWDSYKPAIHKFIARVVHHSEILSCEYNGFRHTLCPLCQIKRTSSEGVLRHLEGWARIQPCLVLAAIRRLVLRSIEHKSGLSRGEWENLQNLKASKRRKREKKIIVDPHGKPQLWDEHLHGGGHSNMRDEHQLEQANERLAALDFQRHYINNVVIYQRVIDDILVVADPRARGIIKFRATSASRNRARLFGVRSFYIFDTWSKTKFLPHFYKAVYP